MNIKNLIGVRKERRNVIFTLSVFDIAREVEAKTAIAAAIKEWSSKTCIKFKERTNESGYVTFRFGTGYVEFYVVIHLVSRGVASCSTSCRPG